MRYLTLVACILSLAVPCFAQTFVLDPVVNCPGLGLGVKWGLVGPYTFHIEYVSGAWSPVPDDSYYGGFTWSSRVHYHIYANASTGTLGGPAIYYQTAAEAESAGQGVYHITVPSGGAVEFFVEELGPIGTCGDNRGLITLKFVWPVPTEATTWGAIKALYR